MSSIMTDRAQARQRQVVQRLDGFSLFWYFLLMVIAPVKMGSDTFRERIPGHSSRQHLNDQRNVFCDHERRN